MSLGIYDPMQPKPSRFYKPTPTYTMAQLQRKEANRQAALRRRAELLALRRRDGMTRTTLAYMRSRPGSGETKFNDSTFNQGTTNAQVLLTLTGAVNGTSFCLIPQGTTQNTRIGNKITLKNIRIKGHMVLATNNLTGDRVRVVLFKDKQANGAAAGATDLFETSTLNSFQNMDNTERFEVVKERWYDMNPGTGTGTAGANSLAYYKGFKINHKANCRIDYSSTAGAITELKSVNYGLFICSDAGAVTFDGNVRVTFTE